MYNILVCDDEKDIVSALTIYLTTSGYQVFPAYDGTEALALLEKEDIHLVLLDIMMPQLDGIATMTRLREKSNVPVILLTAKSEDTDKILGLNVGADDYVTKPFNPVEVLARVKSQLRRYLQLGGGTVRPTALRLGGVALDDRTKEVTLDGEPVSLTPREYENPPAAHAEPRHRLLPQADLPDRVGGGALRGGERGGRPYPSSSGKTGD